LIECYITDRHALRDCESLLNVIARNLEHGPDWIQIREKDLSARALYDLVCEAITLPNPRNAKFLVNSRVDIALASGASGVHLPANSPPPHFWRNGVPEGFLIGVSCHSVEEVRAAEHEDADYVVFGPVFQPLSKAAVQPVRGLQELARAAEAVRIPVLALGGITPENASACIVAGAAGIAGISLYQNLSAL
jgi:thiamine-phosphate pyrophosphorylase